MRSAYQQPQDICARTTHCTFFEWTSKREVRENYSAIATVHIFMECRQTQSACVTYNALWERDYIYRQLVHWSVRLKAVMDDEAEGDLFVDDVLHQFFKTKSCCRNNAQLFPAHLDKSTNACGPSHENDHRCTESIPASVRCPLTGSAAKYVCGSLIPSYITSREPG